MVTIACSKNFNYGKNEDEPCIYLYGKLLLLILGLQDCQYCPPPTLFTSAPKQFLKECLRCKMVEIKNDL